MNNKYTDVIQRITAYQPWLLENEEERNILYTRLYEEEMQERHNAEYNWNIVEAYDWICDVIWTAYWISPSFWENKERILIDIMQSSHYNIDCFEECWQEIRRSNWTKSKDTREDWKIIKWSDYIPPNLLPIIQKYHKQKI